MTLETAFAEIQQFWPTGPPFAFGHGRAAARLFPRLRIWAGPYYAAWCADFDNA